MWEWLSTTGSPLVFAADVLVDALCAEHDPDDGVVVLPIDNRLVDALLRPPFANPPLECLVRDDGGNVDLKASLAPEGETVNRENAGPVIVALVRAAFRRRTADTDDNSGVGGITASDVYSALRGACSAALAEVATEISGAEASTRQQSQPRRRRGRRVRRSNRVDITPVQLLLLQVVLPVLDAILIVAHRERQPPTQRTPASADLTQEVVLAADFDVTRDWVQNIVELLVGMVAATSVACDLACHALHTFVTCGWRDVVSLYFDEIVSVNHAKMRDDAMEG